MLADIVIRAGLPFRKDRELCSSLRRIIGFYPRRMSLYRTALMHKSMSGRDGKQVNNERLEFLGDAVLDAAVADIVFTRFPGKREGFLTDTRSKLVQRDTLNRLAREMGISRLIVAAAPAHTHNSHIDGNAFEALVGAIYLDKGYAACKKFVEKRMLRHMVNLEKVAYDEVNFKSKLLEWCQKNHVELSFDMDKSKNDADGNHLFCHTAVIQGVRGCSGEGYSKKESQQEAAKLTLQKLKKGHQFAEKVFAAKSSKGKDVAPVGEEAGKAGKEDAQQGRPARKRRKPQPKPPMYRKESGEGEFSLDGISAKRKNRRDLVEEAEKAAFQD